MKVLVVPTWYPNGEDKLMGVYHKEFTNALNKNGIEADMIFIDRQRLSNPIKYLFMKKRLIEKEKNYKVYIYRMLNLRPIAYHLYMKSYVHKFERAFKEYVKNNSKPDLIHAMVSVPAGYAACIVGKKYGIPVIVTEHGSVQESLYRDEPDVRYSKYVLENAKMTTVSKFMCDIVKKYGGESTVLPNQIDIGLFKNGKKRVIKDTFNIVSVCALREGKCIDYVLRAVKMLKNRGFNIHYDIVGEGYLEVYYKECAKKLEIEDSVSFLGRKTKEEIANILEDEHALVIASNFETFAIPGVEALASGIPVITTDCKGPTEYIDDKCGVVCKINDTVSLAKAIKKVYENYDSYDVKYLKKVADKYSEETVVNMAKKKYEDILKNKNGD